MIGTIWNGPWKKVKVTNGNLIVEQSTRLVGQIIDDLDRLREEFLAINMEEIYDENPELQLVALTGLNAIKGNFSSFYIFLEGLRKAKKVD
jgi:hypothetical protein